MEIFSPSLLLFFFSIFISGFAHQVRAVSNPTSSPFLSKSIFFPNYQKMLDSFKIFAYGQHQDPALTSSVESLFHSSLLKSPFLTKNGDEAHLFYFYSLGSSTRAIARLVRDLRSDHPYWNRTLGADHFYVSSGGVGYESDRNTVELKKNSVQISCFPANEGKFIPHKDITLPTLSRPVLENRSVPVNKSAKFLGYYNGKSRQNAEFTSTFLNELHGDPDFLVESESIDDVAHGERLSGSRFCLFFYGSESEASGIGEALRFGCVPVIVSDGPILDLPFMDVLKWSEIAVFVRAKGGVEEMKSVLDRTCGEKYKQMRELGKMASQHFVWNSTPQPYDAFYRVLYQLWLRRHTIRYAPRGVLCI